MKGKIVVKRVMAIVLTLALVAGTLFLDFGDGGTTAKAAATVDDFVNVAISQYPYTEGYNNDNKYGAYFGHNNVAWCAYFVSWCARQAGISEDIIRTSAYADPEEFNVPFYSRDSITPRKGDLVFYRFPGSSYEIDHVEIVIDDGQTAIGGNTGSNSDSVAYRDISRGSGEYGWDAIVGFGRPNLADDKLPVGSLEVTKSTEPGKVYVKGWAYDPDTPNKSIRVHVYLNGKYAANLPTDIYRSDVNSSKGISGNHGFEATFDTGMYGNVEVKIYGIGDKDNKEISNSPKTISVEMGTGDNLGDEFDAVIKKCGEDLYIRNNTDNNVVTSKVDYSDSNAFIWTFVRNSDGTYRIKSKKTGRSLDVQNWGTANGTDIQAFTSNDATAQKWRIFQNADGSYVINSYCAPGSALDCGGDEIGTGRNVHLWEMNQGYGSTNGYQKFRIIFDTDIVKSAQNTSYLEYNGHAYKASNERMTYDDAVALQSGGWHLVTITSTNEQNAVIELLDNLSERLDGYWMYANDAEKEGKFKWMTGESYDFSKAPWDKGQPDNYNDAEDYLMIMSNGNWNDVNNRRNYGYIMERDSLHEHSYTGTEVVVVEPTCGGADGEKWIYCSEPGCEEYIVESITAPSHVPGEWTVVTNSTCKVKGTEIQYCTNCNSPVNSRSIDYGPHTWGDEETINAVSCTDDGLIKHTCKVCDKIEYTVVKATGHKPVDDEGKEPTCSEAGKSKGSHCSVCNEVFTAQQTLEAYGHEWIRVKTIKAASCTEKGKAQYKCASCGITKTEAIPKKGHVEVSDKAVTATCEKDGLTAGSHCLICGQVLIAQTTINATGHAWDEGVVTRKATCTESGYKTFTCQTCGEQKYTELSATGHSGVTDAAVPATCLSPGKTAGVHCINCGDVIVAQKIIPAKGHDWDDGEVTTEPTCALTGIYTFTCKDCGTTKEMTLAALGHRVVEVGKLEATSYAIGKTSYSYCATCNQILAPSEIITKLPGNKIAFADITEKTAAKSGMKVNHITDGCMTEGEIFFSVEGDLPCNVACSTDGGNTFSKLSMFDKIGKDYGFALSVVSDVILAIGFVGDCNLDGEVNAGDLTRLARHVAKIESIDDDFALINADANSNGGIDASDLTILARHIAKIEPLSIG